MEPAFKILNHTLSNEALNNLIQTTRCLETLNYLLQIQQRRIQEGTCEKLDLSIDVIYSSTIEIDLGVQILKTTLFVAKNFHKHLPQLKKFCFNKLQLSHSVHDLYYVLNLLNAVCEYYKSSDKQIDFVESEINQFCNGILSVLKGSSKPLITFILIYLLPNYLTVSDTQTKNLLLTKIFDLVKETKKIEILCVCYDKFVSAEFSLLNSDDFWLFLIECILGEHYLKKQAVYLLSKSIKNVLKSTDSPSLMRVENCNEMEEIWHNCLCLLDVSNEKQLHIIEPSLYMFQSVQKLNWNWRVCLYKVFLNHSQNSIVYHVGLLILQNEKKWSDFLRVMISLFHSINKNEWNTDTKRIFQEIGCFCQKLTQNQFDIFLQESLNVRWIPAAVWLFYSNIFRETCFQVSPSLLENLIKNLKLIPHIFIRNGCTRLILSYFMKTYVVNCMKDLLKVARLLWNFDKDLFYNFIRNNEEKICAFCDETFLESITEENFYSVEIKLMILQTLKINLLPSFTTYSNKTDFINLILFHENFESYVMDRIDSVGENEDITHLIPLTKRICSEDIERRIQTNLFKYNDTQKLVAFSIICRSGKVDLKTIIDFWDSTRKSNQISKIFIEILIVYLNQSPSLEEIEASITVMNNIFDSQSEATITILENVAHFFEYVDNKSVIQFIDRCFDELLSLNKNGCFRSITSVFLSQIFSSDLLENDDFLKKVFHFSQKVLVFSNSANAIACILSENVALLIERKPHKGFIFIPLMVDLILYGIIINKNDRVEYHVCQDIGVKLSLNNNPNIEEMSARLLAMDSMINLISKKLPNTEEIINRFVTLLLEKYMVYFSKRYFPDSQIHIQKLRILQVLLLLQKHLKSKKCVLVDLIMESFVLENHQRSVKHLMQWLLISLVKNDSDSFIDCLNEKLKTIDNNRSSTVSGFIPVLYRLIENQDQDLWDRIVAVLLPYSMGAQFKLRIFSQVALVKLYEKAIKTQHSHFLDKYKFLYKSVKQVLEATSNALYDVGPIYQEFLDYFCLEDCNYSTVLYTVPKSNGVTPIEWENLNAVSSWKQMKHIRFNHINDSDEEEMRSNQLPTKFGNIQKKITPWKDMFDNVQTDKNFILVTSLIEKAANLGGLSRTCEVFGIKQMVMRTSKISTDKEFKSLSMSSENWVDISEVKVEDLQNFILRVKKQGYRVIGAEQTAESVKLNEFEFPKMTVLIMGNEKEGIPPDLILLLDECIEIPQFGMVRSLNVHVAGAIVIWEYCKQHKL